ncbi:hypothetical protein [Frankia sp. Cr2]|nr:hypothetical protein [Frankia sp. Cr2]
MRGAARKGGPYRDPTICLQENYTHRNSYLFERLQNVGSHQ